MYEAIIKAKLLEFFNNKISKNRWDGLTCIILLNSLPTEYYVEMFNEYNEHSNLQMVYQLMDVIIYGLRCIDVTINSDRLFAAIICAFREIKDKIEL